MFGRRGGAAAGGVARVVPLDPDRSLVRAAQADPARFDSLYRKYLAQVYSLAFHELGDHHEAEDVTERTFLLALGALPRFARKRRPRPARRLHVPRVALPDRPQRRGQPPPHRPSPPDRPAGGRRGRAASDDVERGVLARADASAAWAAVARLPGDRRRAVVLRFVEEMSTGGIAGVLGRTEGAVRVLLHRALRTVARDLAERGEGR